MCGIAGIYAYAPAAPPVDEQELTTVRDSMRARGPDGHGSWYEEGHRVGLAHRRLSIIDLSERGAQPMHNVDGSLVLTYNGEIYNYQALRDELRDRGHKFRSDCDSEVLLAMYAEYGEAMLPRLRGMYAFGLWDRKRERLLLARDPFGIKPLYYADDGQTLRFASQVKALLAPGTLSREVDPAGRLGFFTFGSVPEPRTFYRSVSALPAGCALTVDRRGMGRLHAFQTPAQIWSEATQQAEDSDARSALVDSIQAHMIADVPVGAFLSSGIDSSALVGLMAEASSDRVRTVTIGFSEFEGTADDEMPLARAVAQHYGVESEAHYVTQQEFEADLPRILEAMDQPSIDGVNTWFVSKAAAAQGLKVAVSGLGGDELLGGYSTFAEVTRWVRQLGPLHPLQPLGAPARKLLQGPVERANLSPKAAGMLEYGTGYAGAYLLKRGLFMPWELDELLGEDAVQRGAQYFDPVLHLQGLSAEEDAPAHAQVAALEMGQYMRNQLLRDTDWASMAHSLEVRVPLVDVPLMRRLGPWLCRRKPDARPKQPLADSPRPRLPDEVRNRPKTGFSTPVATWQEHSSELDAWRRVPSLRDERTHWARRLAWVIDDAFGGQA